MQPTEPSKGTNNKGFWTLIEVSRVKNKRPPLKNYNTQARD